MWKINLIGNNTYKWTQIDEKYFIGYIFDECNNVLKGIEAIKFLSINKDKKYTGIYTYLEKTQDKILILADVINFFPIFFYFKKNEWFISDDWNFLVKTKSLKPNKKTFAAFESAGFVTNYETLDSEIFKTKAGKKIILYINGKFSKYDDYNWITNNFFSKTFNELIEKSDMEFINSGEKLISFLNGRMAVVPLSGGFDSRLIACILKRLNYNNVFCFTYGKQTKETEISRKVAETLNYKWHFIDYTKIPYEGYLSDSEFQNYYEQYANGYCMPYLQEYFAIKYLKEKKLISDDAVFLPGHSGDYLGGSYVLRTAKTKKTGENLAKHITNKYFFFKKLQKNDKQNIISQVLFGLNDYSEKIILTKKTQFNQFVEDWDYKEKLSKFIARSSFVFTFFGYEHYFIFWDIPLIEHFRKIPFEFRKNKKLYNEILIKNFFLPNNVYFERNEIKTTKTQIFLQAIKDKIRYLMPWKIVLKRMIQNDWMNYYKFTDPMNKTIEDKTGKQINNYRSFNAIICKWYILNIISKNKVIQ